MVFIIQCNSIKLLLPVDLKHSMASSIWPMFDMPVEIIRGFFVSPTYFINGRLTRSIEAILYANHFELSNLTVVVDYNKLQSLDSTDNTMTLEPFTEKWISFGWDLIECDGHDHQGLKSALDKKSNKPNIELSTQIILALNDGDKKIIQLNKNKIFLSTENFLK